MAPHTHVAALQAQYQDRILVDGDCGRGRRRQQPVMTFRQGLAETARHFRDLGWSMRVPRRLKDMHVSINGVVSELSQSLGRAPKPTEIAERLGVPVTEVLEGLEASEAYRSSSLDEMLSSEQGSATVGELVGGADAELDRVDFRQALRPALADLAPRERTIVLLRFFGNMTQTQIAQEVGISQMHVSRLLTQTLDRLRSRLDPETRVG